MRYLIEQSARLEFDGPVREHQCELRLAPRADDSQRVHALRLTLEPDGGVQSYLDYFGNRVHACDILAPHGSLTVRLRAEVETLLENPFDFPMLAVSQERRWLDATLAQQPRLWDYLLHRSALTPDPAQLTADELGFPALDRSMRCMDAVLRARDWVTETFVYTPDEGDGTTTFAKVVQERAGNAADLAHVLVTAVRGFGFPARYVAGYCDADPDAALDAVEAHAWVEVLIPGAGWRGFDGSAGLVTNDRYLCVRVGRDAADVPLLRSSGRGADAEAEPLVTIRLQRQQAQQ